MHVIPMIIIFSTFCSLVSDAETNIKSSAFAKHLQFHINKVGIMGAIRSDLNATPRVITRTDAIHSDRARLPQARI